MKLIKQEVAKLFNDEYSKRSDTNLSRFREVLSLPGNQFFLTHHQGLKKYSRRMVSPSTKQYATYFYSDPYETFESLLISVFGRYVCLDTLSNDEIQLAEQRLFSD
jgi:hypothetical protein